MAHRPPLLERPLEERFSPSRGRRAGSRRLSIFFGLLLLAAVVAVAVRVSEWRAFVRLAEDIDPRWFLLAAAFQLSAHLLRGSIWRAVVRAGGASLSALTAMGLSLARTFMNQAVPSAGLSGLVLAESVLERRGVPRPVAMACVVIVTVSYYFAYIAVFGAALWMMTARGLTGAGRASSVWAFAGAAGFTVFGVALAWILLSLPGRSAPFDKGPRVLRRLAALLREADPRLARRPGLLAGACAAQTAAILLDAGTLWVFVRSLGAMLTPADVFMSFMASTLVRTVGIVPGGVGTFEAAAVVTLHMTGLDVPHALSATLLFRGMSFWLPMAPGFWFARRLMLESRRPA